MFSILILGWSGAISSKELLGVMRKMGQNHTDDELISLNRSWSIGQLFEGMFCESFSSSIGPSVLRAPAEQLRWPLF